MRTFKTQNSWSCSWPFSRCLCVLYLDYVQILSRQKVRRDFFFAVFVLAVDLLFEIINHAHLFTLRGLFFHCRLLNEWIDHFIKHSLTFAGRHMHSPLDDLPKRGNPRFKQRVKHFRTHPFCCSFTARYVGHRSFYYTIRVSVTKSLSRNEMSQDDTDNKLTQHRKKNSESRLTGIAPFLTRLCSLYNMLLTHWTSLTCSSSVFYL